MKINKLSKIAIFITIALLTNGCVNLKPALPKIAPTTPSVIGANGHSPVLTKLKKQGFEHLFLDEKLIAIINKSLINNNDYKITTLNVVRAKAQFGIQKAEEMPTINLNTGLNRSYSNQSGAGSEWNIGLASTNYELDLFNKTKNMSEIAWYSYLSKENENQAAKISLIAEIANLYLTLGSNIELQNLANLTFSNREAELLIAKKRYEMGVVSEVELNQELSSVESARIEVITYKRLIAQNKNELNQLVGESVSNDLLPLGFNTEINDSSIPSAIESKVLLERPDIIEAENEIKSANANIGAARAAFFPSIKLTGSLGRTSSGLSDLFSSNTGVWQFSPQINIPIFQGGLFSSLQIAKIDRDIAIEKYKKTIQTGFKEAANVLMLNDSLSEELIAQKSLVDVSKNTQKLAQIRYRTGRDDYMTLLDSERTLYSAQKDLIVKSVAIQQNKILFYKIMGGQWPSNDEI